MWQTRQKLKHTNEKKPKEKTAKADNEATSKRVIHTYPNKLNEILVVFSIFVEMIV